MARDVFGLAGTTLDNRYRVDDLVAIGGFGFVYRAHHLALNGPVAIKVLCLAPHLDERHALTVSQLFVQEAQIIARFDHPHIIAPVDMGVAKMPSGVVASWSALRWLEGSTLREWLRSRQRARLTPAAALRIVRPIFSAVAYAHARGIAHRDIKPANIMVGEHGGELHLRLMDFGVAKVLEEGVTAGRGSTQTASEYATYSPAYGAPEQAKGLKTGPWTDVHGLGLLLTEMLIGAPCYRESEPLALLRETITDPRPTPKRFGFDVGAFEPALARALHLNPASRFAHAAEFLGALEYAVRLIGEAEGPAAAPTLVAESPSHLFRGNAHYRESTEPFPTDPLRASIATPRTRSPSSPPVESVPTPEFRSRPTVTSTARRRGRLIRVSVLGVVCAAIVAAAGFTMRFGIDRRRPAPVGSVAPIRSAEVVRPVVGAQVHAAVATMANSSTEQRNVLDAVPSATPRVDFAQPQRTRSEHSHRPSQSGLGIAVQ